MRRDWYRDEVIPGRGEAEVAAETATVLAFRPPRPAPSHDWASSGAVIDG